MKKRDIILVNAPFTDLSGKKIRPALVLGKYQDDLLICFVSSKKDRCNRYDVLIKADTKNNLRADSIIRCSKIFTLHSSLSKGILGEVNPETYKEVTQKIEKIIQ